MNVLFVCSQNKLRSPTAEHIVAGQTDIQVSSAGTNHDAENPVDAEQIGWANIIVVMERTHRKRLQQRFRAPATGKRIVCLDIKDEYDFMDPGLIRLLQARMAQFLP